MAVNFSLYPNQRNALLTEANEILFGGAAGGGKSHLIRVATIVYSLEIPGLITYLFRRKFKEVVSNHIYTPNGYLEMLGPLIRAGDVRFAKTDYSFEFNNGSRIQLAHSQYESDIYTYQGAQIGFLVIDEATHFTEKMVRFIRSRVRLGSLVVPEKYKQLFPRILYTANPGGVSHHYFKSNFVDFGSNIVHDAPSDEGGMRRVYIPARLSDNIVMLRTDPEYKTRLQGLGDTDAVKAMLDGDWELLSTGGFADVWRAKYHVVEPFPIPRTWRIDRGYDYGSSNPAACLWFAEADGEEFVDANGNECWVPKGTIFQIGELYFANKRREGLRLTADEQARRIKNYENDEGLSGKVKPGPADNAIFSSEPGHKSVADDMADEGITFVRGNKRPGSRILGVEMFRSRLKAGTKRPMERPGYFVFSNCYHTIRTVPNLENDEKKQEDIDTHGEDHIWDVIRYKVLSTNMRVKTMAVEGV